MSRAYLIPATTEEEEKIIETAKEMCLEQVNKNNPDYPQKKLSFKKMVLYLCKHYLNFSEKNDKLF